MLIKVSNLINNPKITQINFMWASHKQQNSMITYKNSAMSRVSNCSTNLKRIVLIWVLCLLLFFLTFQMVLKNSSFHHKLHNPPSILDASASNVEQRTRLYDKMSRDLDEHGPTFLKHDETSQSLSISELFNLKGGVVTPKPKAANPPVRANVLYLSTEYSTPISNAVKNVFSPYFEKAIWFQNSSLYHFSMFHASHHISSVPATEDEIEAEANAVRGVVETLCPLKIVLDRVVLTSTGALLGCWQVTSGSDPTTIRAKLRSVLPHAPEKQLYDPVILHTTLARLLGHPRISDKGSTQSSDDMQIFHELVARLNNQIRGFEAMVSELWYVEEFDVLALALDGRMKVRKFHLGCSVSSRPGN